MFVNLLGVDSSRLCTTLSGSLIFLSIFSVSAILRAASTLFMKGTVISRRFSRAVQRSVNFLFS